MGNIFFDISNTNFTIGGTVACGDATGLTSSAIGDTTATVSWTAVTNAISYAVDYKLNSTATWTSFSTAQTTSTASITGLTQGSLYDWRVKATCAAGSGNFVAAQFTTTTPFVCAAPAGLTASAITSSGATISWTAVSGAASYAVDYKLNTATSWTSAATATTSVSIAISGLTASSLYDYRVSTNCGANGASGFTAAQFTTIAASVCGTAFEPNETQAAAAAITSGVTNSAAITTATDIDYFKITTTATSNIAYNLVGPTGVDYDLYVYNSAGTQIGSGAGSTATETVSLTSQAAGTYYIKVMGYSGANSATCYTIKATATVVTSCQSNYDVSTNGTTSGAAVIPFNSNVTGLISPSADIDNYKFVITTAGTITLTLTTLPADYDLKLLNSAGTQVGISQAGGTTSETINYTAAAGTYYAQVFGYNGANSAASCYTLKVALGTATKPGLSATGNGVIKIYPNPVSDILNISLLGEISSKGAFEILDGKGATVLVNAITRNPQVVNISKLPKGTYLVRVNNGINTIKAKFVKQ